MGTDQFLIRAVRVCKNDNVFSDFGETEFVKTKLKFANKKNLLENWLIYVS